MNKKEKFIYDSKLINNDNYKYDKIDYKGCCTKVELICIKDNHGSFWQTPNNHISKKQGCPKCKFEKLAKDRSDNTGIFIIKSTNKHGLQYDYSKSKYKGNKIKVEIICKEHGSFSILPSTHIMGQGCPKCGIIKSSEKQSLTKEIFLDRMNELYNNNLCTSKVKYKDIRTPVEIICYKHGSFNKKPLQLLKKHGCNKCSKENKISHNKMSIETSVDIANKIHNFKYDYTDVDFERVIQKVDIKCPKHGIFKQIWHEHYKYGKGCPKCVHHISKPEIELANFVKSLNLKILTSKRNIITPKELDIYIPSLNKAIEFNGEWWHYSKKYFKPGKHAMKSNLCREKGIKLLHIREDLWLKNKNKMKQVIEKFLKQK